MIVKRVIYNHDELQIETDSQIGKDIAEISEWCMVEAGNRLKLNVPLAGEAKIGLNWAEVH